MTFDEIRSLKAKIDELYARAEWGKPSYTAEQIAVDDANREMRKVLINNYFNAILTDVYPIIAESWNACEGKKFGPKTKDKMWTELRRIADKVGLEWFTPHSSISGIYNSLECKMHYRDTECTVGYKTIFVNARLTDADNKILPIPTTIPEEDIKRYPYIADADAYIESYHKNMENLRVAQEVLAKMQKSIDENYRAMK